MNGPENNLDRKSIGGYRSNRSLYRTPRDPQAAARIGIGIYDRGQILLEHPEAGSVLDELRDGGWRKLIFRLWKIVYTIFVVTPSSSAESGLPQWVKPIWRRRSKFGNGIE